MDIWKKIKYMFRTGSSLNRLIYINLGVYVLVLLVRLIYFLFNIQSGMNPIVEWGAVPSTLHDLLSRPWTILSYMFIHEEFLHILFNLLWLFWMGQIFLSYLDGRKLLSVYILGGISGAALFILAYNLFPAFLNVYGLAIGASASVYAITFAIAFFVPNYDIHLFLIGKVKLKYLAVVPLLMDILTLPLDNAGGKIAHVGGAIFGYLFIMQYKRGKDITAWFGKLMDSLFGLFKHKSKLKISYAGNKTNPDQVYRDKRAYNQKEVDLILDKINRLGYNSLSKEEKETLFKMSQKN